MQLCSRSALDLKESLELGVLPLNTVSKIYLYLGKLSLQALNSEGAIWTT